MYNGSRFSSTINYYAYPWKNGEMVSVFSGTYQMGSTGENPNEEPVHNVTLSGYFIGKYEVTQKQWREVVRWKQGSATSPLTPDPSYFKGDSLPVEQVSWNDVQTWIEYLNEKEGTTKYRLPTEAEWEYAARRGDDAWYYGNSNKTTHTVGTKPANNLGIYDMRGNVWEWCQDWYGAYTADSQTNPTGPATGTYRVLRGGAWSSPLLNFYSYRDFGVPYNRDFADVGFRLVRDF
jgi:formylglycine-generating enzyme required for sulfatase activity